MTTYYKGQIGKEDINFGYGSFNRKDKNHANKAITYLNAGHIPTGFLTITTDYELSYTEAYGQLFIRNVGARTLTLPPAQNSMGPVTFITYWPSVYFTIDPSGTEYFRDCAAGKYKRSNIPGNWLKIWCITTGVWEWDYALVSGNWDNED